MFNHKRHLFCGVASIAMLANGANAAEEEKETDLMAMDEIVATAVSGEVTKMKSSVSVSSISTDEIQNFAPRNTAEIFRNIPGIRSESTGGEGNANIAVRGLPVASGGAKFLQLHEDGLPVLEFGDIAFGNADIFLRSDYTVDRIEAVRGGSASTFVSNSPGGVINLISKTGEEEGGSLGATIGLDFNSYRTDFEYGGEIAGGWRFHVGGFYRIGEGPRNAGYNGNDGGQIKANITKEFETGYVRLYVKHLNDRGIGYLPMPVRVTGTNADPEIGSVAGFDASGDTPHSPFFQTNFGIGGDGARRVSDVSDGMRPISTVIGGELSFDIADDWVITDKFRVASNKGRFVSPFPAEIGGAQAIADSVAGAGAILKYANGPSAGSTINPASLNGNGLLMRMHVFDTELNDLGNFSNDFKLSRGFDVSGDASVNLAVGYYKARQTIDMDWLWNSYLMEVKGEDAALVDVYNLDGEGGEVSYSDNGLYAYGVPAWGNCCQRSYDATYDIDAPYASLSYENDKLTVDASIRYDSGNASGTYAGGVQQTNLDVNQDGNISIPEQSVSVIDNSSPSPINYDWGYWSYSAGANYAFDNDLAAFARISRGGRANADRLLFGKVAADGSAKDEDVVDFVNQVEAGVKYRADNLAIFATAFYAKTEEQNFEATTQKFFDRVYKSYGLEVEAVYQIGGFNVNGSITYTDAEISKDALNPAVEGNTPRRQAKFYYTLTPSYMYEDFTIGANVIGTTKSFAQDSNELVMPGFAQVNAFAYYEVTEGLTLAFNVNNLFDTIGLTESEEGSIPGNNVIRARSINGRSMTMSLRYRF